MKRLILALTMVLAGNAAMAHVPSECDTVVKSYLDAAQTFVESFVAQRVDRKKLEKQVPAKIRMAVIGNENGPLPYWDSEEFELQGIRVIKKGWALDENMNTFMKSHDNLFFCLNEGWSAPESE